MAVASNAQIKPKKPGGVTGRGFVKGQSGNPKGRPPLPAEVRDLARAMTPEAFRVVAECLRSKRAPWPARMRAVEITLERAWGKAIQPLEVNDARPLAGVPAERLLAAIEALAVRVTVTVPDEPDGLGERGA